MPVLPSTLVDVSRLSNDDNAIFPPPLSNAAFTLDSSGVAGFFGGDSSVAGMATVNLIRGRRWGGWYNTPGSYEIAKQYGPLGNLPFFDGLFPEGEHNPARLFRIDGDEGPQFIGVHSGTVLPHTGHLGRLIASWAKDVDGARKLTGQDARSTTRTGVTIVNLRNVPKKSSHPPLPTRWHHSAYFSFLPVLASVAACVVCALVADWFCFASIAVGIIAHGSACYVIGSGKLTFTHPIPAEDAPCGDGVLKGDGVVVILLGAEGAVNAVTRGRFHLQYGAPLPEEGTDSTDSGISVLKETCKIFHPPPALLSYIPRVSQWFWCPPQGLILPCALLLMGQFLVQLLLIPLGTLFGQIMFIATVVVSWTYNTHLSSISRESIQTEILFQVLDLNENSDIQNYQLGTWTATVAFTSFVLSSLQALDDPHVFLDTMLPNNTPVWKAWKNTMSEKLKDRKHFDNDEELVFSEADIEGVDEKHRRLLTTLFHDTKDTWDAWSNVRDSVRQMVGQRN